MFLNFFFFNSSSFVCYSQNLFLKRLSVCIAFLSSLFTKSASFVLSVLFLIEHVYLLLWETHFLFGHSTDVDQPGLKKYLDLKWRCFICKKKISERLRKFCIADLIKFVKLDKSQTSSRSSRPIAFVFVSMLKSPRLKWLDFKQSGFHIKLIWESFIQFCFAYGKIINCSTYYIMIWQNNQDIC